MGRYTVIYLVSALCLLGICFGDFVKRNRGNCSNVDDFECDGTKCIESYKVCNSQLDCQDKTDEEGCDCLSLGYIPCNNGTDCIHEEQYCMDRETIDCKEYADQIDCSSWVTETTTLTPQYTTTESVTTTDEIDTSIINEVTTSTPFIIAEDETTTEINTEDMDTTTSYPEIVTDFESINDTLNETMFTMTEQPDLFENESSTFETSQEVLKDEGATKVEDISNTSSSSEFLKDGNEYAYHAGARECSNPSSTVCLTSGYCIYLNQLCDGVQNCEDGSDEQNCPTEETETSPEPFPKTTSLDISNGKKINQKIFPDILPSTSTSAPVSRPEQIITTTKNYETKNTTLSGFIETEEHEETLLSTLLSSTSEPTVAYSTRSAMISVVDSTSLTTPEVVELTRDYKNCNAHGTADVYEVDNMTKCACKENVVGENCSACKENAFYLNESNEEGCLECFCMNVGKTCRSSSLKRSLIKLEEFFCYEEPFVSRSLSDVIEESRKCSLPKKFIGDKITSYGGKISFYVQLASRIEMYMKGKNALLIQKAKVDQRSRKVEINFTEKKWKYQKKSRGKKKTASRSTLMAVLANIEYLHLKVVAPKSSILKNEFLFKLRNFTMTTSTNSSEENPYALEVENCTCQDGYTGVSCHLCEEGYQKSFISDSDTKNSFIECKKIEEKKSIKKEYLTVIGEIYVRDALSQKQLKRIDRKYQKIFLKNLE